MRLQDYFPVARFSASFYINTRERFSLDAVTAKDSPALSTAIDEV